VALYKKYKQVNMPNLKLDDAQAENLVQFLEARAKENTHAESPENHETATKANSSGTR
jgi:hypothetical protein